MSGVSNPNAFPSASITRRKLTIAAFFDYISPFSGGYQAEIRDALDQSCREHDLNLLSVYGRALEEPNPKSTAYNSIYELFAPGSVDGVIVLSTTLGTHCGVAGLARFLQRFRGMPLCSLGLAIPNVPSVVVDNRQGMDAIMEHMLGEHGARHVAFIQGAAGSPEAHARFQIYRAALERYSIDYDPALVACGSFQWSRGQSAMEDLLSRQVRIDAVVAANDLMALGAMDALRKHGYRVPSDLAVTGFDDIPESVNANQPLTTVAQPYSAMARCALQLVLDQIDGKVVALVEELPARLVPRRSCGCRARSNQRIIDQPNATKLHSQDGAQTAAAAAISSPKLQDCAADSAKGQAADLPIREVLYGILDDLQIPDSRRQTLDRLSECSASDVSELWSDACERVASARQRELAGSPAAADTTIMSTISIGERISVSLNLESFRQALSEALPRAGLNTGWFSRFVDSSQAELEPLVALLDGRPIATSSGKFEARALFPPGTLPAGRRYTLLVFPLVFDNEPLGVAIFEFAKNMHAYQMIRDLIATSLKTVSLHGDIIEQIKLSGRTAQEQERMATAKRMQALSVLAGGVAHDLNNVLGPLVALPDIMIRVLDQPVPSPEAIAELREDLQSIKGSSLRAAQTIKDLLTMSRQGRTTKEPVDLAKIVTACLTGDSLCALQRLNQNVEISHEVPGAPLVIRASESHVGRAIANLTRNAVEAIRNSGRVVVRLSSSKLTEPVADFDEVPAGNYAILTVSDNGDGIAEPHRVRIFEPFFSQKHLGEQSGSGLGLAIVHSVVKEHDGYINFTSKLGSGTTFTLYFPCANEVLPSERISEILHRGSARILVLDDDRTQLRTCRRVLSHLGYEVDTLSNAQEVCDRFAESAAVGKSPYDLVILDMVLHQNLDGLEVYQRIQTYFPAQKAILVSGYAATERAEAALKRGVSWVVKPYTAEILAKAVRTALSGQPSLTVPSFSTAPPLST